MPYLKIPIRLFRKQMSKRQQRKRMLEFEDNPDITKEVKNNKTIIILN